MPEFSTPMMRQYMAIKKQYSDCLLFFRMGDFYELFMDDAHVGASVLDITLTSRPEGKDGRIPMAGVPYHAVDSYLAKLVKAGYKVAICEQVTEPNNRGIVEREVVRVVTPGTLLDEKALEKKENNYLIALTYDSQCLAIAAGDLSTGDINVTYLSYTKFNHTLENELAKTKPAECILSPEDYNNSGLLKVIKSENNCNIFPFHTWKSYSEEAEMFLKNHFGVKTLTGFGIEDKVLAQQACAALVGYLKETQKDHINHLKKIRLNVPDTVVALDKNTMINLELFSTLRERDPRGSLHTVIDKTQTAMGGRMLRQWLAKPLTSFEGINNRYDAIEGLLNNPGIFQQLQYHLKDITDIERLISKLSVGIGNARDIGNVKNSFKTILYIKALLPHLDTSLITAINSQINLGLRQLVTIIEETLVDEPPVSIKDGGLIRTGVDEKLDRMRDKIGKSKEWLIALEAQEKERTGISSLKVRFNKVFGYYIEVSRSNSHLVPSNYLRKQTLVNGERFITPELKEQEEIILTTEVEINALEYRMYEKLLENILVCVDVIQEASSAIATLDCLCSFAALTQKNQYVRPKIIYSGEIKIKGGRHPVVEEVLEDMQFVPNDVTLDQHTNQLLIITGPNMAGKSVFIRQVALIVLMAQIGCYVPAEKVHISLVDKIFVRSGASDVITSGLSTFMVEMMETAHILNHATKNSLIVMDEIGRGTSTYDGISIAWAVAQYLVTHTSITPKTLFATHYHELQALERNYSEKIKNYHMAVDNTHSDPIFLHTIMPGSASHSFGVAVAKLAGIPQPVIENAQKMLHELESRDKRDSNGTYAPSPNNPEAELLEKQLKHELDQTDINAITPIEALNTLALWKKKFTKEPNLQEAEQVPRAKLPRIKTV